MSNPRLSVAQCTYEGEDYLEEQLNSIAGQVRPPDEMIVCDDGSRDGTVAIVERFQSRVSFPVGLYINEKRLGYTKNFERAISLCQGDFIFLADQDDVWHSRKLATLLHAFDASPRIGAVFSDADVVDEQMIPLGYSLWDAVGFTPGLQRRFPRKGALDILLKRNVVSGMTLGFRTRFRDLVVPLPAGWFHDCWIPLLIAAVADVRMVPERLVKYRQHERQELGLPSMNVMHKINARRNLGTRAFLDEAKQYEAAYDRVRTSAFFSSSPKALSGFEAKIRHIRARAQIRSGNRRLSLLVREFFALNYHRYASGWKSIAADVFLA